MHYKCRTELQLVRQLWSDGPLVLTDVAGHEGDHQLLGLGALAAGLGDDVLVEQLHGALKAGKLHHCVGDLPHPQRNHTLVEAAGGGDIVTAQMKSRRVQNTNTQVVFSLSKTEKLNIQVKGPVCQI